MSNKDNMLLAANQAAIGLGPTKTYDYPIKRPTIAPGVVSAGGQSPVLALDDGFYNYASMAYSGVNICGGFPGFPYLAMLSTRAEYRAFAAALSTEITREWIMFDTKQEDPLAQDKLNMIEAEFKRLNVRDMVKKAVELDCFFGRAHIYLKISNQDIKLPLVLDPRTVPLGSFESISTVEPIWTSPATYNALDPTTADFYKPTKWFMLGQETHSSRLMTIITREMPDMLKPAFDFAGISLSQLAEPYVDNWIRTRNSVGDLINNFSITALATSMDQIFDSGLPEQSSIFARAKLFTAMRSNQGLMLLDKEREELVQVNTPLGGLHELQSQAQEHMCVSKGTLINTLRGEIPIEKVKETDKVLTRNGYAPVQWVGITGFTNSFIEIKTDNSILKLTRGHPIWDEKKQDFVFAKNVEVSQILRKNPDWVNMDGQLHGGDGYGAQLKRVTIETLKLAECYTGFFTKHILVQYQKIKTFITKMKMGITTLSTILNFFPVPNILKSMNLKGGYYSCEEVVKKYAMNVQLNSKRHGQTEQNFARINVKQNHGSEVKEVNNLPLNKKEAVYNIKVADGFLPEFYANGILVHNCSVSRMPAIILTGISPSGLNASSDGEIRIFYDWISAQQEAFWRAPIETILKLVQLNLFGEIDPDISFHFVPLYQMTGKELSEIRKSDSDAAVAYINAGVIDPQEERERLANNPESGYQGLDLAKIIEPPAQPDPFGGFGIGEENGEQSSVGESNSESKSTEGENLKDENKNNEVEAGAKDKSVSEAQHNAMEAAAHGESTLGIPKKVGKEFADKDENS